MSAPLSSGVDEVVAQSLQEGGWTIEEVVDDVVEIDALRIHRTGVTARGSTGAVITGSAAARRTPASARAWFELLERASILASEPSPAISSPDRMPSRSNGVALAHDWRDACRRARLELAERDRILRSWQGELRPEAIDVPSGVLPALRGYTWRVARLGGEGLWSADTEVVVVVGFGDDPRPLLRGFGAGEDLAAALRHAASECVQALAFLAAEDVPIEEPTATPTPVFHLDRYLWRPAHATLHRWLDGRFHAAHVRRCENASTTYTDITPTWGKGRFHVARARCEAAYPLVFGRPSDPAVPPHPIA